MANTTEMLRLMRHAADRLAEEKPLEPLTRLLNESVNRDNSAKIMRQAASLTSALTLAESVLRMVAAAMDDEPVQIQPDVPAEATVKEVTSEDHR
jgi:hypothetical protein